MSTACYIIGMTGCAAGHAAVNGGEALAPWANVNTLFPCRRTSPLIGKGQVPYLFARQSVRFIWQAVPVIAHLYLLCLYYFRAVYLPSP